MAWYNTDSWFNTVRTVNNNMQQVGESVAGNATEISAYDYLSYKQLLHDRIKFQRAGGPHGSEFNTYDQPGGQYFRILFHFFNENNGGNGLLHPTWGSIDWPGSNSGGSAWWAEQENKNWRAAEYIPWRHNTAYSYLIMNDEQERAAYLKKFIELLSNINSESPWYFYNIKGIEEGINRKQLTEDFIFNKERNKITIECLPDSIDQRIGTLLDLYRACAYSWTNKREIIPANLRKFDMSVIVFQVPVKNIHTPGPDIIKLPDMLGMTSALLNEGDDEFATMNPNRYDHIVASYKIYEFHNCEFDYNSTVGAADNLSNEKAFQTVYNIGIFYDDMYEIRHNEFMDLGSWSYFGNAQSSTGLVSQSDLTEYKISEISDLVLIDTAAWVGWDQNSEPQGHPVVSDYQEIDSREPAPTGLLVDAVSQLSSLVSNKIDQKINKLYLGNIFGFSVSRTLGALQNLAQRNILGTIHYIKSGNRHNYNGNVDPPRPLKNLFADSQPPHETTVLGNIFRTNSALSNI